MSIQTTPLSESDEEFLDRALERALEALEDGGEPTVEDLLEQREHLRDEVDSVLRMASQLAQPRPASLPRVHGYTLVTELGRGGMGAVYLAQQEALGGRRVALKVLPAGAGSVASSRERFLREARTLASLRHPHVVTVHDVIVEDGCWAYAMEWIDGPSLAQVIEALKAETASDAAFAEPGWTAVRGLMPGLARPAETWAVFVCRIGVAIARALGELHRAGLVHRDVKPGNVLLRANGTPLLSDFGLVLAAGRELTHGGHFLGTLDYAPPEQLTGDRQSLDARSDVYALGVTLYHALTLRFPFDSPHGRRRRALSPSGMLRLIETGRAAPLRTWNRRLPRDLETVLAKAIDPEPARRYASADELADDLERLLSLQPIRARAAGPVTRTWKLLRRHRGPAFGIVAGSVLSLALALAAMTYVFLVPRWVEAHVREARLALMDPLQANLLFNNVYWGKEWQGDAESIPERSGLLAALPHYDSALRWAPFDEAIRLERDVVRAVLDAPRMADFSSPAAPDDLRSAGLAAYLLGDVASALRSWERFEEGLDPTVPRDPLVETGLGILYLVRNEGARAYPRLRDACQAFPDVGFLTSYLADAALRCGDHDVAERLLDAASRMPRQDPQLALTRITADLLSARGQDAEAEALYRRIAPGTPATLHHARFLHARGRVEEAFDQYVLAVSAMRGASVRAEYARVLEGWWAALGPEERSRRIRASVGRSPWDQSSLVTRLRYYTAGTEPEKPRQSQPIRDMQSLPLAELARVLEVEDTAHWTAIVDHPPLLVCAERGALGSPWRAALSRVVRQLAVAYELVSGRRGRVRDASPPLDVSACTDAPCFRGLGDLPGGEVSSSAVCLSSDGSTVGGRSIGHSGDVPFVWRAETGMISLSIRGAGAVSGLSADGSVAVGSTDSTPVELEHAWRWTRSEGPVALDASDREAAMANSVSDDGLLVAGQGCAEWKNASTWSPHHGWTPLDAGVDYGSAVTTLSPDGRWAAGWVQTLSDAPEQAIRWSLRSGEKIVAARESKATGVSDSGTVVGYFEQDDPSEGRICEAMSWTGDEPVRSLGDLPGGPVDSVARAILRDGTWIAGRGTSEVGEEAVLWDEHRNLYRMQDILDASGAGAPSGWRLVQCNGITRNGDLITICGSGTNPAGDPEAWIARFRVTRSVPPSAPPATR